MVSRASLIYQLSIVPDQVTQRSVNQLIERNKELLKVLGDIPEAGSDAYKDLDRDVQAVSGNTRNLEKTIADLREEFALNNNAVRDWRRELRQGGDIGIGSVNELRNRLIQLRREYDSLGPAQREAFGANLRKQIEDTNKELLKLETNTGRFARTVNTQRTALTSAFGAIGRDLLLGFGIVGAIDAVTTSLRFLVDAGRDFEFQFSEVVALLRITGDESAAIREELRQQAIELGSTTAFTATEAASAQATLARAGFSSQEILDATGGVLDLAQAAGVDLATAADIAAGALRAYGLEASAISEVNDILARTITSANLDLVDFNEAFKLVAPQAAQLNIPMEELAANIGTLANSSLRGSVGGTALRGILVRLLKPSNEAADVMADLGIEVFNANGEFVGLNNVIGQFEDAAPSVTQLVTLFGRNVNAAAILTAAGADRLSAFTAELGRIGVLTEVFNEQVSGIPVTAGQLSQEIDKSVDSAAALGVNIETVTATISGFEQVTKDIEQSGDLTRQVFESIANPVAGAQDILQGYFNEVGELDFVGLFRDLRDGVISADEAQLIFGENVAENINNLQAFDRAVARNTETARLLGVDLSTVGGVVEALVEQTGDLDLASNAAEQFFTTLATPAAQAEEALQGFFDNTGALDFEGLFKAISEGAIDSSEVQRLFGDEIAETFANLDEVGANVSFDQLVESLEDARTAAEIANERLNNLEGDTVKLRSATEGLAIRIFDQLNPSLRALTQGFTTVIGAINEFLDGADTVGDANPIQQFLDNNNTLVNIAIGLFGALTGVVVVNTAATLANAAAQAAKNLATRTGLLNSRALAAATTEYTKSLAAQTAASGAATNIFTQLGRGLRAAAVGARAFGAALLANPIGLVIAAVAALTGAIILLRQRSDEFRQATDGIFSAFKAVIDLFLDGTGPIARALQFAFLPLKVAAEIIQNFPEIIDFVTEAFTTFTRNVRQQFSGLSGSFGNFGLIFRDVWNDAVNFVQGKFDSLFNALPASVQTVLTSIGNGISQFFDIITAPFEAFFDFLRTEIGDELDAIGGAFASGVQNSVISQFEKQIQDDLDSIKLNANKADVEQVGADIRSKILDELQQGDITQEAADELIGNLDKNVADALTRLDFARQIGIDLKNARFEDLPELNEFAEAIRDRLQSAFENGILTRADQAALTQQLDDRVNKLRNDIITAATGDLPTDGGDVDDEVSERAEKAREEAIKEIQEAAEAQLKAIADTALDLNRAQLEETIKRYRAAGQAGLVTQREADLAILNAQREAEEERAKIIETLGKEQQEEIEKQAEKERAIREGALKEFTAIIGQERARRKAELDKELEDLRAAGATAEELERARQVAISRNVAFLDTLSTLTVTSDFSVDVSGLEDLSDLAPDVIQRINSLLSVFNEGSLVAVENSLRAAQDRVRDLKDDFEAQSITTAELNTLFLDSERQLGEELVEIRRQRAEALTTVSEQEIQAERQILATRLSNVPEVPSGDPNAVNDQAFALQSQVIALANFQREQNRIVQENLIAQREVLANNRVEILQSEAERIEELESLRQTDAQNEEFYTAQIIAIRTSSQEQLAANASDQVANLEDILAQTEKIQADQLQQERGVLESLLATGEIDTTEFNRRVEQATEESAALVRQERIKLIRELLSVAELGADEVDTLNKLLGESLAEVADANEKQAKRIADAYEQIKEAQQKVVAEAIKLGQNLIDSLAKQSEDRIKEIEDRKKELEEETETEIDALTEASEAREEDIRNQATTDARKEQLLEAEKARLEEEIAAKEEAAQIEQDRLDEEAEKEEKRKASILAINQAIELFEQGAQIARDIREAKAQQQSINETLRATQKTATAATTVAADTAVAASGAAAGVGQTASTGPGAIVLLPIFIAALTLAATLAGNLFKKRAEEGLDLEDYIQGRKAQYGGLIRGPSHAQGGVPVLVNRRYMIEAEGKEFILNAMASRLFKAPVRWMNDQGKKAMKGQRYETQIPLQFFKPAQQNQQVYSRANPVSLPPVPKTKLSPFAQDGGEVAGIPLGGFSNRDMQAMIDAQKETNAKLDLVAQKIQDQEVSINTNRLDDAQEKQANIVALSRL